MVDGSGHAEPAGVRFSVDADGAGAVAMPSRPRRAACPGDLRGRRERDDPHARADPARRDLTSAVRQEARVERRLDVRPLARRSRTRPPSCPRVEHARVELADRAENAGPMRRAVAPPPPGRCRARPRRGRRARRRGPSPRPRSRGRGRARRGGRGRARAAASAGRPRGRARGRPARRSRRRGTPATSGIRSLQRDALDVPERGRPARRARSTTDGDGVEADRGRADRARVAAVAADDRVEHGVVAGQARDADAAPLEVARPRRRRRRRAPRRAAAGRCAMTPTMSRPCSRASARSWMSSTANSARPPSSRRTASVDAVGACTRRSMPSSRSSPRARGGVDAGCGRRSARSRAAASRRSAARPARSRSLGLRRRRTRAGADEQDERGTRDGADGACGAAGGYAAPRP